MALSLSASRSILSVVAKGYVPSSRGFSARADRAGRWWGFVDGRGERSEPASPSRINPIDGGLDIHFNRMNIFVQILVAAQVNVILIPAGMVVDDDTNTVAE